LSCVGACATGRRRVRCTGAFRAARSDRGRTWLLARRDEPGPARRVTSRRKLRPMRVRMRCGGWAILEQREGFDEGRRAEDSVLEIAPVGGEHVFVKLRQASDGRPRRALRTGVRTREHHYLQAKIATGRAIDVARHAGSETPWERG